MFADAPSPGHLVEDVAIQVFELITFQLQTLLVVTLTEPVDAR